MLDPDTLYVIHGSDGEVETYARTPDGVGCYWYDADQREEAEGDVSTPTRTQHFDSDKEFDDHRDRMAARSEARQARGFAW